MPSSRDTDSGKRMVEEEIVAIFAQSFAAVTGRVVTIIDRGEAPDFVADIDGVEVGLELTEIRAESFDDYMEEVERLVGKKEESYKRSGAFRRPILLICYSEEPPVFEMRHDLDSRGAVDLSETLFSEIWLMDMSDEYFSPSDPRKPADFYCLAPAESRGLYARDRTRKPFG